MSRLRPIVATGLLLAAPSAPAQVWEDLTPAGGPVPPPRTESTAIYDPVENRMIVFGGQGSSGVLDDTWAFDLVGHQWTELTPASGSPPARLTPDAVYDAAAHEMLMWAGQGSGSFFNDVWSFDLDGHTWTELTPPDPLPNLRYGTASVFDPVARTLVTFAGFTNQGRFDDTWRFDPDTETWTEISPASGPHERCLHSASYDIRGRRMIMYGGQQSGAQEDIWALDLAAETWTDLTPNVYPTPRWFTAHVHDAARGRSLIFGGGPGSLDDVWAFDLETATWWEITPAIAGPAGREGATGIYVAEQDSFVIFGGGGRNDVWALRLSEPGGVVFPGTILGDGEAFRWPVPVNVDFVRGDLADVASLAFDASGSATYATSFPAAEDPGPGQAWFYLARVQGEQGSWQSTFGDQPQRDDVLP